MNLFRRSFVFAVPLFCVTCFLFLSATVFAQPTDEKTKDEQIEFARDHKSPFLTYSISGGRKIAALNSNKPKLQIWPSGKIVCGGLTEDLEAELSEKELHKVVSELVKEKKIYELSAGSIQKEIEKLEKKTFLYNVPTSKIELNLKRGKHLLEIVGSELTLQQIPKLKEMKRAREIERFLELVIARTVVGGQRQEKQVVAKINDALKAEYAKKYAAFKFEDVKFATHHKGGRKQVTFERIVEDKEEKASFRLVGRYTKGADGKESATVSRWGMPKMR